MSNVTAAGALPLPPAPDAENEAMGEVVSSPLRTDLVMQRQLFRGAEYYVIKDPLALTYFRLQHVEGFLITLLDGKRTLKEVHRLFLIRFPNEELTVKDIAVFVNQMSGAGLLNINARRFVSVARARETVRTSWLQMWGKLLAGLLFMRFPLFDPSGWLGGLSHAIRFVWTKWFVGLSLAFITWTVFWLVVNADAFAQNTINFFSADNLFLVWVTIIFVKTIHEFGHATTCRHFGGEVHEMGICLICFAPAGYVDASDAWMMRNKAHKLYTTIAGIFIEFVIAGIAAHLWLYLPAGLAKNLAFNAMIVASVNTVFFNANPLMKFDGYYVLSDYLEIPNLRTKAMAYCSYHIQRLLLGYRNLIQEGVLGDERHNRVFIVYAVLAFAYMLTVIVSLVQVFANFLAPYGLHDFGLALGLFVEGSFVMFPIVKVLSDAFSAGKGNMVRERNVLTHVARWLIPTVVLLSLLAFAPSHFKIGQQAVITAATSERAGLEVAGVVEKVHVKTGAWVDAGQPILTLRNDDVTTDATVAQINYLESLQSLSSLQSGRGMQVTAQAPKAAMAVESAAFAEQRARRTLEQLIVRAPTSGYVVTPDLGHFEGQFLPAGFSAVRVADLRRFKIMIPLTESEAELIEPGSPVRGYIRGSGQRINGTVTVVPREKAGWEDYQPAMLSAFGGPAPFETIAATERTPPAFGLFIAEAEILNPPDNLIEGLRVEVKVSGRKATYGQRISRWWVSLWRSKTAL